ncbi:hypothetical protein [Actinomadura chokoriensis]|uniref:Lipoprotein n=1 Tax=Actinomadura chokoriensis TaxID=454156 RepID=A0ABV4R5R8_9ACTN
MFVPFSRFALTGVCALLLAGLGACGAEPVKSPPAEAKSPQAGGAPAAEGPLMTAASASWVGDRPIVVRPDLEEWGRGRNPDAVLVTGTLDSGFGTPRGPAGPHTGGLDGDWFLVFSTSAIQAGRVAAPRCELPVEGHPDYCMEESAVYGIDPGGPNSFGVYTPHTISVYDGGRRNLLAARGNSILETRATNGALKAGEAFEVIVEPKERLFTGTKIQSGDVAMVWLNARGTSERIRVTSAMPAHVFLPVSRPTEQ